MSVGQPSKLSVLLQSNSAGFAIIALMSMSLIFINYFTIKTQTAVRAYVGGESFYSKGQKDATRSLILYLLESDSNDWNSFKKNIEIPLGDSIARKALLADADRDAMRNGFLQGMNHPSDVDNMIWLVLNFKNISFMQTTLKAWKEGDAIVTQLLRLGHEIHQRSIGYQRISDIEKKHYIKQLNQITIAITEKEYAFNSVLGDASRKISRYLFIANIVLIILIVGSASIYAWIMIVRLRKNNTALKFINRELDQFVYSASHDLRAPITSMQGLIEVAKLEEDSAMQQKYLVLMSNTLQKQDDFIRSIIDYSRNKKITLSQSIINLEDLINDLIDQHAYMPKAQEISFIKNLEVSNIKCDPLRLEIILRNLISNAIKYAPQPDKNCQISINSKLKDKLVVINIADNGMGIPADKLEKIFNMFYVTQHSQKGSGIGLYIARETIQKMGGSLTVSSSQEYGTCFSIVLPLQDE